LSKSNGHRVAGSEAPALKSTRVHNATLGVGLLCSGVAILLGLIYIANDTSELSEHLVFSMGLAVTSLVSALGQVLAILGLVYLWKARRASSDR